MSWDANKYFSKGQVYWHRASAQERDSDQFLINVAFACEFIIRGALCNINPSLNSALDGESILYASGITPRKPPKTVDIAEALERLQRFIPEISEDVKGKIKALIDARNRELHGDNIEMAQISTKELMPSVYSLIVKVAEFAKQDIKVILGEPDAKQAIQVAQAITKNRTKRVKDLIAACRDRFYSMSKEEQKKKREDVDTKIIYAVLKSGHHLKKEKCPACSALGSLIGIPVGRSSPILKNNEIIQEVRVIPSKFECKSCGLDITGLDELIATGFSHEFCTIDTVDPVEHFNIDPLEYIDAEEVAREYNKEMYEYQDE